ncbi:MAG TPA: hypothetical protein VFT57_10030 [Gemmatimonadaceae bacterium]|jgi:hypothetical protein|nr:hypothetical protein [Gemmatimonadaceae bacterium]
MWLVAILFGWLPWLLLGGAGLWLGLRAVRALERRGTASTELTALRDRLQMLEDQVTEQGEAVRRLTDGQEFTQRLLLERASVEGKQEKSTPAS